ncbi:MAG: hypothetical protein ACTHOK_15810 [Nocardioidaceae bacterium]
MPEPAERKLLGKEGSGLGILMLFLTALLAAGGVMIWVAASIYR